jgi:hypothetical protein
MEIRGSARGRVSEGIARVGEERGGRILGSAGVEEDEDAVGEGGRLVGVFGTTKVGDVDDRDQGKRRERHEPLPEIGVVRRQRGWIKSHG